MCVTGNEGHGKPGGAVDLASVCPLASASSVPHRAREIRRLLPLRVVVPVIVASPCCTRSARSIIVAGVYFRLLWFFKHERLALARVAMSSSGQAPAVWVQIFATPGTDEALMGF
ncbi:hypothetical protein PR202_gb25238 [Eleusine coracana subsp. coracana]|uniref:Uncharacterized protein n=1 Tax=Eleusine coracana subsp. coracana TaxID=191504 RepID=A0AAV5FPH3_ELECO|nr:hypothetical protein PR202_gb25238 [Eleusine coracana subsp. coracana]